MTSNDGDNHGEAIQPPPVVGEDLVQHHIESYDAFVKGTIDTIIASRNPLKIVKNVDDKKLLIELHVKTPVRISQPTILPMDARNRSWSYTSDLTCTAEIVYTEQNSNMPRHIQTVEEIRICRMPVMLRSSICRLADKDRESRRAAGECPYDYGGYFIADGQEKVFVAQERAAPNRLLATSSLDPNTVAAKIACRESVYKAVVGIELRCHKEGGPIHVFMSAFGQDASAMIPLCILMRAIGITSDEEIVRMIFPDGVSDLDPNVMRRWIEPTLEEGARLGGYTRASCTEYMFNKIRNKPSASGSNVTVNMRAAIAVADLLERDFLPHVSKTGMWSEKGRAMGRLVREFLELVQSDDVALSMKYVRDNFLNKRIMTTGPLMAEAFYDLYNEFLRDVQSRLDAQFEYRHRRAYAFPPLLVDSENKADVFKFDIMSTGFSDILKGVRGLTRTIDKRGATLRETLGVVQELNRVSYLGFLSHMRRVAIPVMTDTQLKTRSIHTLKADRYGFICPSESPDGIMIGILNNLAINTYITHRNGYPENTLIESDIAGHASEYIPISCGGGNIAQEGSKSTTTTVYINNVVVGTISAVNDYRVIADRIRELRRTTEEFETISVVEDGGFRHSLKIYSDAGRCLRKLIWLDGNGVPRGIELLGVEEIAAGCYIATDRNSIIPGRHTHCELHQGHEMFSVYTATVPFANHNQAPRVVFSAAQGKQAVGMYATTFSKRMDTHASILNYPQRALVSTRLASAIGLDTMCSGQNLIVAIACRTGFNEEDAVILNRASVDRGMFQSTHFHTHYEKIDNAQSAREGSGSVRFFANPTEVIRAPLKEIGDSATTTANKKSAIKKNAEKLRAWRKRYHALVAPRGDGTPNLDAFVQPGDAIIGVCSYSAAESGEGTQGIGLAEKVRDEGADAMDKKSEKFKDMSVFIKGPADAGYIDAVQTVNSNSGIKVRIRQSRRPTLGDKVASRHGQKGVVGHVMDPDDMPFTDDSDALVPDIIVPPYGHVSRMTLGQLMEAVVGAEALRTGKLADGSAFDSTILSKEIDELVRMHPERHVIDGVTGRRMPVRMFMLPTFYQRLKHMVVDKVHSRRSGPMLNITGQPTAGRAMNGGLRLGEMERDAILGSGSVNFLKEAYVEKSDKMDVMVDTDDGCFTSNPPELDVNENKRGKATVPRALKSLIQEMEVLNVQTHMTFG